MFWEKNKEAFLCYRIKAFFKKLVIIGQSSENNNNVWSKIILANNIINTINDFLSMHLYFPNSF